MIRHALVTALPEQTRNYLPSNYSVIGKTAGYTIIRGEDHRGWTLQGYIIPRCLSGLIRCREITSSELKETLEEMQAI